MSQSPRHFLDLLATPAKELRAMIEDAKQRKAKRKGLPKAMADKDAPLQGLMLAIVMEQASTRTRTSLTMAAEQLGAKAMMLDTKALHAQNKEEMRDTAAVLSRYVDMIALRTGKQERLDELAHYASVPVINAMTNISHPCQLLADVLTVEEQKGAIAGKKIAWLGDGNNMAYSWMQAAKQFDFSLHCAIPESLMVAPAHRAWAEETGKVVFCDSPESAAQEAEVIVTDSWVSLADAVGVEERKKLLAPYQVTREIMALGAEAIFLHCLPAMRGFEVAPEVLDDFANVVLEEAENRLHTQKSVMLWCANQIA